MGGWSCLIYIWYTLLYVNAVVFLFLFIRGLFYDYIRVSVFWGGACLRRKKKKFECGLYDKIPLKFNLIEKIEFFFS